MRVDRRQEVVLRREVTVDGRHRHAGLARHSRDRHECKAACHDPTGGVEVSQSDDQKRLSAPGPMVAKVASMGIHQGLSIDTVLDPAVQPFLHDHQIDGTPVLPGVMGIEAFAEAALCMLPGWHIEAIEDVNFLAPFKFYRGEPRTITIQTLIRSHNAVLRADCALIGLRSLPNQTEPHVTKHFTGRVRLNKEPLQASTGPTVNLPSGSFIKAADIYRIYFHGPAYQVLEQAWWDGDRMFGAMSRHLPANHQPDNRPTVLAPRLIELCFQTAGLWEMAVQGRMGLPLHIDHVRVWQASTLVEGQLFAIVTPLPDGGFDAQVVNANGNRYGQLSG